MKKYFYLFSIALDVTHFYKYKFKNNREYVLIFITCNVINKTYFFHLLEIKKMYDNINVLQFIMVICFYDKYDKKIKF